MIALLIPFASAALAQAAEPPAPTAGEPPEITVTCRTQRVTGTRVIKKVCRNVEQLRQDDRDARAKLRMGTKVQATEVFLRPKGE
jgi:hypothetical protein